MNIQNLGSSFIPSHANVDKSAANNQESSALSRQPGDSFTVSSQDNVQVVPGEYIVKFRGEAPEFNTKSGIGAELIKKFDMPASERSRSEVCHIRLDENIPIDEAIQLLMSNSNTVYAEPNYIISVPETNFDERQSSAAAKGVAAGNSEAQKKPDDLDSKLWGLDNTGQTGGKVNADINAPEAWTISTGKKEGGPLIAVIDTGIDLKHPDLIGNLWTNPGEIAGDGIDNDGNGYIDDIHGYDFINKKASPDDDHSHGTHCAGTIAAEGNNGQGITGVAWKANMMALKTLGTSGGTTAAAIDAVNYATKMGVDIISASWGGGGFSVALHDAISSFPGLFIAAAGNSSSDNDARPHYPSSYDSPNIIAVASTDHNDELSSFSCYGKESVDVAAPGSKIYSTIPGGDYGTKSGTSMATPHVSGVAALVMSQYPELSALEVKEAILNSGDSLESLQGKVATGKRVNVHNALLYAAELAKAKEDVQA